MAAGQFASKAKAARSGMVVGVNKTEGLIYFGMALFYMIFMVAAIKEFFNFAGVFSGFLGIVVFGLVNTIYTRALQKSRRAHPHGFKWRLKVALWFPVVVVFSGTAYIVATDRMLWESWPLTLATAVIAAAPMFYLGIWMLSKSRGGAIVLNRQSLPGVEMDEAE